MYLQTVSVAHAASWASALSQRPFDPEDNWCDMCFIVTSNLSPDEASDKRFMRAQSAVCGVCTCVCMFHPCVSYHVATHHMLPAQFP